MPIITTQLKLEGVAVSISDCEMRLSTGPLFDFGTLDDRTNQLNVDCVATLSDCTLQNITTSNQIPVIDSHQRMIQKVVNCRISSSFGNIWGAISCGLDTPESFFGMNCSFSNIQPSSLLSAPHSLPTNTNSIFESQIRQESTCDELILISCRFSHIEGTEALIHLNTTRSSSSRTVTLTDCSFHECGCSDGSPSTLLLCGAGSVCLFDVSFVKCGGLNGSSIIVIENSFVDSTSSLLFVDSGSSELYLTDLVNPEELGLIGDTDSPSPSPFLSAILRTHLNRKPNLPLDIIMVTTLDESSPDFFTLIFHSDQLKSIFIDVELGGIETQSLFFDQYGNGILECFYRPYGPYGSLECYQLIATGQITSEYEIQFEPPDFCAPTMPIPVIVISVEAVDAYNPDYFMLEFYSPKLQNIVFEVFIVGYEFQAVGLDSWGYGQAKCYYRPYGPYESEAYLEMKPEGNILTQYDIQFDPPYVRAPIQQTPVPIIRMYISNTFTHNSSVEIAFYFSQGSGSQYTVTLVNTANQSDTWTTFFDFMYSSEARVLTMIYPVESGMVGLKWGGTYEFKEIIDESHDPQDTEAQGSITIPPEPARIEGIVSRSFSDKTVLTLTGRLFETDFEFSLSPIASSTSSRNAVYYPFTAVVSDSNTATCTIPAVDVSTVSTAPPVAFGAEYSIAASILVDSGLRHTISAPVSASSIVPQMKENGKECTLLVTGSGFIEDEHFVLGLTESSESNADPVTLKFDVVMRSSTEGESSPIELGKEDSLNFDTTYTIVKLHLSSDSSLTARTPLTLATPSEPSRTTNVFHVDGGVVTESNPCGTITSPCQTVDRALQIIKSALFIDMSILVTRSPVLSQSFEMQSGMTLILKKAGEFTETVKIPSTSVSSSPLLILTDGRFKLDHLSFTIENTSPSLCLFSTTNTEVELENVHMTGPTLPPTSTINEEIENLCSWETGLIKAKGGVISASECHFSQMRQGVFSVNGSNVTLSFCKLTANSPPPSVYPSLQWNIRCVGSGEVSLEIENNETSQQESHWISTSECAVTVNGQKSLSPFVYPTLSVSDCSVSQNKSKDPLVIRIVGTKLIPCGLSFEIFESTDSKSNSKTNTATPHRISLSDPSVSSSSETEALISVLESSTKLEKSSRWDGRLIFGDEQATQSFTVKISAKEKMTLATGKIVPWLVPLLVSLVVLALLAIIIVVVVLRRRKQKKEKEEEMQDGEVPLEDEKMEVIVTDHKIDTNPDNSIVSYPNEQETAVDLIPDSFNDEEEYIEAIVCMDGVKLILAKRSDTLYNRLHSQNRQEVIKRGIQKQIASGLTTISQKASDAAILKALSSHNILLDESGRVCFKTNTDIVKPSNHQSQVHDASLPQNQVEGDQNEGNEQEPPKNDRKEDPATEFFSLGLILWEIETGSVPYGEQDGANAVRQISAGVPPDLSIVRNTEMKELIEMCLAINPKDRPQLGDIASALNEIEDTPVNQPKESIES
ncbi:hypothetical protein BLNAU_2078 [Blattamonas nauphoetae]|uniref:Protein kinase domain-containing protein n=1 Tax=Blattamonas nauphoetae TaxID=2049346 RepID=A0ABQ9YH14_9EUKA|nr:hypothetical protein BLNAU_2078 [Blattamonas nauphoetae]